MIALASLLGLIIVAMMCFIIYLQWENKSATSNLVKSFNEKMVEINKINGDNTNKLNGKILEIQNDSKRNTDKLRKIIEDNPTVYNNGCLDARGVQQINDSARKGNADSAGKPESKVRTSAGVATEKSASSDWRGSSFNDASLDGNIRDLSF